MSGPLDDATVGVTLAVADVARARHFYEDVLGLTPVEGFGDAANIGYACAGGAVLNVYRSEHAVASAATRAGFEVKDLPATVRALRSRGAVFESYDDQTLRTDADGIARFGAAGVAYLRDPDGNMLSIACQHVTDAAAGRSDPGGAR